MAPPQSWIRGRLLGAGAFGSVNLAMKRENGEVFAVKSVPASARDAAAVRAIENEIEILQGLDSRHVVRCFGSDWTEESGLVMRNAFLEYMPEGCLIDFVKQFASSGALDEHLLRTYTRSIVEGIDYLHSQGIVHCDIKGKNILVGNGAVKLTDFGSSKRVRDAMAEADVVNCAAKVNGTPLWMAPEVVRQVEQGPASDIWSLGCTVVEMATGRAPWSNFTNHLVTLYHIGCTDELPEVPASLSAEAHDFLSHCFQRDPSKRWTSSQLLQHPFLTTRFVATTAPCAPKVPVSPISVMYYPADSDSDLSASFVNSVPTLAAPSLFKRGLVSAHPKVQEQVEENWWSTADSPASGPWIVVRSPKSSTSPPSFVVPADIETPSIVGEYCAPGVGKLLAEQTTSVVAMSAASAASPFLNFAARCLETSSSVDEEVAFSAPDDSLPIETAATDVHVRHFAISEMDFNLPLKFAAEYRAVSGNFSYTPGLNFLRETFQSSDEAPSTSLKFGCGTRTDTTSEYSEHENVYLFSNPQILLYWLHTPMCRDFECLKSGHSNHCCSSILPLDEYNIPLQLQTKNSRLLCVIRFHVSAAVIMLTFLFDHFAQFCFHSVPPPNLLPGQI